MLGGAVVGAAAATLAYTPIFVGLGLKVRRALIWGLVYIVVFEGVVASVGSTLARFSVRLHVLSLTHDLADVDPTDFAVAVGVAAVVLGAIAGLGTLLTNWFLVHDEVR